MYYNSEIPFAKVAGTSRKDEDHLDNDLLNYSHLLIYALAFLCYFTALFGGLNLHFINHEDLGAYITEWMK
jgi:hypothetical protein